MEDSRRTISPYRWAFCFFSLVLLNPGPGRAQSPADLAKRGEYQSAIRSLEKTTHRAPSDGILLGELYLTVGEFAKAQQHAKTLRNESNTRGHGLVLQARVLSQSGRYREAIVLLQTAVREFPMLFEARVRLSELLWTTGTPRRDLRDADAVADYWEAGDVRAKELLWLAKGLHLTEYFKDANSIFYELREQYPDYAPALLGHAELFLEKEDEAQAGLAIERVLAVNPYHPDALVLSARMDLSSDGNPKKALERARAALSVNPKHVGALRVLAAAYVETEQYDAATEQLEAALALNPRDPETLAFRAALALLREDSRGFKRWMAKALNVNPRYAAGLHEAAELIVRVHRYREAVELDKKAIAIDPEFAPAWVGLGIGLSRLGQDTEANEALQKAFQLDSYNVRAYNMTRFFYDGPVKEMFWHDVKPFRLRLHRREEGVLKPLVSTLVHEANETYKQKYAFTPKGPLHIEIFPEKSTFEIRTAGYPRLGVHAVCFGHLITSRSPSEGTFNWGMVLWHELAHVWHIQMSQSRVPRWFTEGLAEYETASYRPEWRREMDEVLFSWFQGSRLKSIKEFNSMFIHADGLADVVVAYYYATQVVRFIVSEWGFEVIPEMLKSWGRKKSTDEVFTSVLKTTTAAFDKRLQTWLRDTYFARYRDATQASDARDASEAELAYSRGLDALRSKKHKEAVTQLRMALDKGGDGPELRFDLATAALRADDPSLARIHLKIACEQDPQSIRIHSRYLATLEALGDKDAAYVQRQKLATLREDDVKLSVLVALEAHQRQDKDVLIEFADRALDIAPFSRDVRVLTGWARLANGEAEDALREADLALSLPSETNNQLGAKLVQVEAFLVLGRHLEAKKILDTLPAENTRVQALKQRL